MAMRVFFDLILQSFAGHFLYWQQWSVEDDLEWGDLQLQCNHLVLYELRFVLKVLLSSTMPKLYYILMFSWVDNWAFAKVFAPD